MLNDTGPNQKLGGRSILCSHVFNFQINLLMIGTWHKKAGISCLTWLSLVFFFFFFWKPFQIIKKVSGCMKKTIEKLFMLLGS